MNLRENTRINYKYITEPEMLRVLMQSVESQSSNIRYKAETMDVCHIINIWKEKRMHKDKYQRKKKWLSQPDPSKKQPNDREFILFLKLRGNTCSPIFLGTTIDGGLVIYHNVDGNNRMNAIINFLETPFTVFPEFLDNITKFIDKILIDEDPDIRKKIKAIFKNMDVNTLEKFDFRRYFEEYDRTYGLSLYELYLKKKRDEWDDFLKEALEFFKTPWGNGKTFSNVDVETHVISNCNREQLGKIFKDLNKYKNNLTKEELLCADLVDVDVDLSGHDEPFQAQLKQKVIEYYKHKNENEKLECYEFNNDDDIQAYDLIIALQAINHEGCKMIKDPKLDNGKCFIDTFKVLFDGHEESDFTKTNTDKFIKMLKACNCVFKKVYKLVMQTGGTGDKKKRRSIREKWLSQTASVVLIAVCIKNIENGISEKENARMLYSWIIFHTYLLDLKDGETKGALKSYDPLCGGSQAIKYASTIYKSKKEEISPKMIDKTKMRELFENLVKESLNEKISEKKERGRRRGRRWRNNWEHLLMQTYFNAKVPQNLLKQEFWNEHIFVFSSQYDGKIDIERPGNVIPIPDFLNLQRKDKNISKYKEIEKKKDIEFIRFIDMIPPQTVYDEIAKHREIKPSERNTIGLKNPKIINNAKFNEICEKNETILIDTLITHIYDL